MLRHQRADRWLAALNVFLVIALAYVCARLIWLWVEPLAREDADTPLATAPAGPSADMTADFSALTRFDPFHRDAGGGTAQSPAAPAQARAAPETDLDLKLFGVRADGGQAGTGSAIIRTPEDKQVAVETGEAVMDGVVLRSVFSDRVVIARGGVLESLYLTDEAERRRQRLRLQGTQPRPAEGVPADDRSADDRPADDVPAEGAADPAPAAGEAAFEAGDIFAQIQLRPRVDGDRIDGFYVHPAGDGRLFRQTGLEPGDVLLSINGQRIDTPDMAARMAERLKDAENLHVEFERAGRRQTLTIALHDQ